MKLEFYADEWQDFVLNCGFTDEEMPIVELLRQEKSDIYIYTTLYISKSVYYRKKKRIKKKILHRIEKAH